MGKSPPPNPSPLSLSLSRSLSFCLSLSLPHTTLIAPACTQPSSDSVGWADYSKVDVLGVWRKSVSSEAKKSPDSPNWRDQTDRESRRLAHLSSGLSFPDDPKHCFSSPRHRLADDVFPVQREIHPTHIVIAAAALDRAGGVDDRVPVFVVIILEKVPITFGGCLRFVVRV